MRNRPAPATGSRWRVVIDGSCSFLSLPRLSTVLASVPAGTHVTVELEVDFLDHPVHDTLEAWRNRHVGNGGTVSHRGKRHRHAARCPGGSAEPRQFAFCPAERLYPVAQLAAAAHGHAAAGPDVAGQGVPGQDWQGRTLRARGFQGPTFSGPDVPGPLRSVLDGVDNYHRRNAHLVRPHVQELSSYQDPGTLFVACSDSRVVPNLITSSGPGDLFTVRNVGNVVGDDGRDASIEAALEFALNELSVESIVVCGHSGCGAMTALWADPDGAGDRGAIDVWLDHARPSLTAFRDGHPVQAAAAEAGYSAVDQLAMVNVAVQLDRLQGHPGLQEPLVSGRVHVAGLFYDISTARVLQITPDGIGHLDPAAKHPLSGPASGVGEPHDVRFPPGCARSGEPLRAGYLVHTGRVQTGRVHAGRLRSPRGRRLGGFRSRGRRLGGLGPGRFSSHRLNPGGFNRNRLFDPDDFQRLHVQQLARPCS